MRAIKYSSALRYLVIIICFYDKNVKTSVHHAVLGNGKKLVNLVHAVSCLILEKYRYAVDLICMTNHTQ
jgi:hypothetical protein